MLTWDFSEKHNFMLNKKEENISLLKEEEKYKCILIFGPPGVGKGTIGKFISNVGGQFHLSSGEIFRSLSPDSPTGKIYFKYASNGNLVPNQETIDIWNCYVKGLIATNRFFPKKQDLLLDGIPRTLEQARILDDYIRVKHIIVLQEKNQETLFERLQKRAKIEGRIDDFNIEILKKRLEIYQNETAKVLQHYSSEKISYFNAEQKPLEVFRDILLKLSDILTY